jgi:hypothetical protein
MDGPGEARPSHDPLPPSARHRLQAPPTWLQDLVDVLFVAVLFVAVLLLTLALVSAQ